MVMRNKINVNQRVLREIANEFFVKPRVYRELLDDAEAEQRIAGRVFAQIMDALGSNLAWEAFANQDEDIYFDQGEEALWRIRSINGMRMNDLRAILKRKKIMQKSLIERAYTLKYGEMMQKEEKQRRDLEAMEREVKDFDFATSWEEANWNQIEGVLSSKRGSFAPITDQGILAEIEGCEFAEISNPQPGLDRVNELMVKRGYTGKPVADGIEYDLETE
jgi:hypothetical protein